MTATSSPAEPPKSTLAAVLAERMSLGTSGRWIADYNETPESLAAAILAATPTAAHVAELEAALAAAEARLRAVEALYLRRDVAYPVKFKFGAADNYVAGYRAAQCELRAALTPPQPAP